MKLALLNTSIVTAVGEYVLKDISIAEARYIFEDAVQNGGIDSAIGHKSTADILSVILKHEIPVNRQVFSQEPGQVAIVFKLNGRPEEGKVLTKEEIEKIGYKFQLLIRTL